MPSNRKPKDERKTNYPDIRLPAVEPVDASHLASLKSWELTTAQAAYLLYCVQQARVDFRYFCMVVYRGYMFPRHLLQLIGKLQEIEHTPDARTIVTMPPRYGKSLTVSTLFPAWYMGRNPDKQIITSSYSSGLTSGFAAEIREIMEAHAYRMIFPGVEPAGRAMGSWGLKRPNRGSIFATGVTSGMTGRGADMMIIDDPIRDMMYADSPSWREKVWDWYTSVAYTRLHPAAPVFVIATRWHHDDLSGRLLTQAATEGDDDIDQWDEVYFPALLDNGKALWPERFPINALARIRQSVGSRTWNALYQGKPTPAEGQLFKRWMFRKVLRQVPDRVGKLKYMRYWDKAGTDAGGDWTVGTLWAKDKENRFYIIDVVRGQWSALKREQIIRDTAELDATNFSNHVKIGIEQEPGSGGLESVENSIRRLAGFKVVADKPSGSLELRSDPLATQLEAGNVYLVAGDWHAEFIREFCEFPLGVHDDQVASSAGAFKLLTNFRSFRYDTF